ncbi:MAG: hypothetical protein Q7Q71_07660 [Verrucomicrobiota bacterium JB023]|nr:hypothetical protein [Verrucomicrobiota bacterium JB023]
MNSSGKKLSFAARAHSLPRRREFYLALAWTAPFYLALILSLIALVLFLMTPEKMQAFLLVGLTAAALALWAGSFFSRRQARCPLCRATPYFDNGAMAHEKSFRLYPLNCAHTNVLRTMVIQSFRCQYCGTPFDLLKENRPPKDDPDAASANS